MKLSFEGRTLNEIQAQMATMLAEHAPKRIYESMSEKTTTTALPAAAKAQGPGPDPFSVETPVDKPVDKPVEKPGRTAKQLENDERLRERAKLKAETRAAQKRLKAKAPMPPEVRTAPPPKTAEGMDPAEVVKVRQKTIEDLQSAYANGFQKEVFELLSRFGNGAKSFRELPPESFVPIREAIDNGALTT